MPEVPDEALSTATLLLREGVPLAVVQRVLRHEDPKLA
jgi:hypothetical protein